MKRSEINAILRRSDAFIKERGFFLPPFAYFSQERRKSLGHEWDEAPLYLLCFEYPRANL